MSPEKTEALMKDFPSLYKGLHYFECGDGWERLLRRLSENITSLPHEPGEEPVAVQVKEKFGYLRFYMFHETDEMETMIRAAEVESSVTCEECGAVGELRDGGWLFVACNTCHEKRRGEDDQC